MELRKKALMQAIRSKFRLRTSIHLSRAVGEQSRHQLPAQKAEVLILTGKH